MTAVNATKSPAPGFGTEYSENYKWDDKRASAISWAHKSANLFDTAPEGNTQHMYSDVPQDQLNSMQPPSYSQSLEHAVQSDTQPGLSPEEFYSTEYPSVYRETVIHKDERGHYIDPFKGLASKPYGRRLMYDQSHPEKMYASQWSSELADVPGCYSFPTTTGLAPEQPWTKNLSWKREGEEGCWPTGAWKEWTHIGECPTYDGHSDQPEYSKYKVQVP